jgi:hypothetical protein
MIQPTQLIEDEEVVPGAENSATVTRRMGPSPTIMMISADDHRKPGSSMPPPLPILDLASVTGTYPT